MRSIDRAHEIRLKIAQELDVADGDHAIFLFRKAREKNSALELRPFLAHLKKSNSIWCASSPESKRHERAVRRVDDAFESVLAQTPSRRDAVRDLSDENYGKLLAGMGLQKPSL